MSTAEESTFHLVFHVGAGKTGTSSIQASLRQSKNILNEHCYDYWGLMLESAPVQKYAWQNASAYSLLLELPDRQIQTQVENVVRDSVENLLGRGYSGAIWSNELFFSRASLLGPVLKKLESAGVRITIISYVRRHDNWAKSAYLQWGLKHKNYPGKVKSFAEFFLHSGVQFSPAIERWKSFFPDSTVVRNFDAAVDVVEDFVNYLGLPARIPSSRVNDSPSDEELFLRAAFNNSIDKDALPSLFEGFFGYDKIDSGMNPSGWMRSLLPSKEDLENILSEASKDIKEVNKYLEKNNQPPIAFGSPTESSFSADYGVLLSILYQILIREKFKTNNMRRRIEQMESDIRELRTSRASSQ